MAVEITPDELLVRACAALPSPALSDLVKALAAQAKRYNDTLIQSPPDKLAVAQGEARASLHIFQKALNCHTEVAKIKERQASAPPSKGLTV